MRPLQQHRIPLATLSFIPHNIIHLVPPSASDCEPHGCKWQTTSSAPSADFHAYAATIIIILLCALICALVLHGAIRCFLSNNGTTLPSTPPQSQLQHPKPASEEVPAPLAAAPVRVFVPGMKLAGAEPECAICLTEFVAEEEIRVLETCQHGFHVPCIEKWLFSHSSCPTCRSSCIQPAAEVSEPETATEDRHRDAGGDPPGSFHSV